MRQFLAVVLTFILLAISAALASATIYLVQGEVLPAVAAGSLSIETDSMILNRVWRGNEIYLLFAFYAAGAIGLAAAAFIVLRSTFFSPPAQPTKDSDE